MIKAGSLYETVLSIAIISIVITLATFIYFNVTNSFGNVASHQLTDKIDSLKNICIEKQDFSAKRMSFKEYEIYQNVEDYQENENLKVVTFLVLKDSVQIDEKSHLIRKK